MALSEVLFKVQCAVDKVKRDGKNPHHDSTYPTLEAVLDVLNGPVEENAITIRQFPAFSEGQWVLRTSIEHALDKDTFDVPLLGLNVSNPMQALGSAITYARRQGLMAYFKLAPTDDDGTAAGEQKEPALEFVKGKKADTKAPPKKGKITPVDHKVGDGKYKGKFLSEIPKTELATYIQDIEKATSAAGKKHPKWFLDLKQAVSL